MSPVKEILPEMIAPCGMICSLCLAFQRTKNRCNGCMSAEASAIRHCSVCLLRNCEEHKTAPSEFCRECRKFPCPRMRQIEKRYVARYGMSFTENMDQIRATGAEAFSIAASEKWRCKQCGQLLCVHRNFCLNCGAANPHFPQRSS